MKAQVLLPKVFNFPFTYNQITGGKIGDLVEVPFGAKKEIGVIWKDNFNETKNLKLKDIHRKTEYTIDKKLINFIEWFSLYNMVPMGLVLKMAIGGVNRFTKIEDKINKTNKTKKKLFVLNGEQTEAVKFLEKTNNRFDVSVLQGTTGSGKL